MIFVNPGLSPQRGNDKRNRLERRKRQKLLVGWMWCGYCFPSASAKEDEQEEESADQKSNRRDNEVDHGEINEPKSKILVFCSFSSFSTWSPKATFWAH